MSRKNVLFAIMICSLTGCTLDEVKDKQCQGNDKTYEHNTQACITVEPYGTGEFQCHDGSWIPIADPFVPCKKCNASFTACDTNTGICEDGQKQYVNDANALCVSQTCVDNQWKTDEQNQCSGEVSCKRENDIYVCGDCKTNTLKCENDDEGNGNILTCIDGRWSDNHINCMSDATHKASCLNETQCAACREGAVQYINNTDNVCTPQICHAGEWIEEPAEENPDDPDDTQYPAHQCMQTVDGQNVPVAVSCKQENGVNACGACLTGSTRCTNNEEGQGITETCINAEWTNQKPCLYGKEPVACNDATNDCGECKNDETEIGYSQDNNIICTKLVCKGGQLVQAEEQVCTSDVSCKIGQNEVKECGECQNGNKKCSDTQIDICQNGQWDTSEICGDAGCIKDKTECSECSKDEIKYENNEQFICQKYICNDGFWKIDENYHCENECRDNVADKCAECNENTYKCEFKSDTAVEYHCENGKWQEVQTCPFASCQKEADGDTLCGDCAPGASNYKEDDSFICHRYECHDGTWPVTADETATVSCHVENGQIQGFGECRNTQTKCNGQNDLQTCVNGKFEPMQCDECVENNGSAQCISHACTGDEPICENNILTICGDNNKKTQKYCEFGKCADDGKNCASCLNDVCNTTNDVSKVRKCIGGILQQTEISCENNSCNAQKTDCGVCKNGDLKCETNGNTSQQMKCENGAWVTQKSCGSNSCSGTECGECINGSKQCKNNSSGIGQPQICENGKWINDTACNNVSCNSTGTCGNCINAYQKCGTDNTIFTCQTGDWVAGNKCSATSCTESASEHKAKCGECKNGTTKYDQGAAQICQEYICIDGSWKNNNNTCADNVSCKTDTNGQNTCGDCHNFEITIKDTQYITTCMNGKKLDTNCTSMLVPATMSLGNYGTCADMNKDNIRCYEMDNIGYKRIMYSAPQNCSTNANFPVSCKVTGTAKTECGLCKNGATQCINANTRQTCVNGNWGYNESSNDCKCTTENATRCSSAGALETCTSGYWKLSTICQYGCQNNRCLECASGTQRCLDNKTSQTCENGIWKSKTCDILCAGNGICGECNSTMPTCENATTQKICDYSTYTWKTQECGFCSYGTCYECQANIAKKCNNTTSVRTCGWLGTWASGIVTQCSDDETCVNGTCI